MGKTNKIKEQNKQIRQLDVGFYMIYIENYFQDCHNYQFLHALIVCLYKYKPAVIRDILHLFCSMFDVKWKDMKWREEHFQWHQNRLEELKKEEGRKVVSEHQKQLGQYYKSFPEMKWQLEDIQAVLDMKEDHEEIFKRIKKEIDNMKCSYQKIAEPYGISLSKIKKITSKNEPKSIKAEDLLAYAKTFGCSVPYLLCETKDPLDIRIAPKNKKEKKRFAAQFPKIQPEVQELLRFLLQSGHHGIIERLFLVTTLLEEKEAQDLINLFLSLSRFAHEERKS